MSKARSLADLISGGATIEASEIADSTITGGKLASDIAINTTGTVTTTKISGPSYTNLTNYSEEFDNAFWGKNRATISANATIAPDGTTTADSLIESTDNNTHYANKTISSMVTLADGDKITLSVYAKAGTRDHLFLSFNWSNSNNTAGVSVFDLSNGTISNTASNHDNVVMEDVGEGWYRCSITDTHDANNGALTFRCDIGIASGDTTFYYTGDGSSNIYIWGASFSLSDRPISYIKTVTSSEAETETYVETKNFNVNSGALYIDTDNRKVGIGTSTPSSTLDVNGNLTLSGNIIDSQNNDTIEIVQNDIRFLNKHVVAGYGVGIRGNRGTTLGMDYSSALGTSSLALNTNATQRITISYGGDISFYEDTGTTAKLYWDASTEKLGIGTTSPDELVHISTGTGLTRAVLKLSAASDQYLTLRSINNGTTSEILSNYGLDLIANGSNDLRFYTNSSFRMVVNGSGNVGIGTSSPTQKLDVSGTVKATAFQGDGSALTGTGSVAWGATVKTSSFTAVSGNGYFVDTTSSAVIVTLPASPSAGDNIGIIDYAGTFNSNNCTIDANGNKIEGSTDVQVIQTNRTGLNLIFIDSTQGWLVSSEGSSDSITAPEITWDTAAGTVGTITDTQRSGGYSLSSCGGSANLGTPTFSITSGALPTGLSMSSSGVISGTVTNPVSSDTVFSFTVTASISAYGYSETRNFTVTVNAPVITFATASGSIGTVADNSRTDGSYTLSSVTATVTSGSLTYAVTTGSLPASVSLNSSTGAISGNFDAVGSDTTTTFTITATETTSAVTASREFSITVNAPVNVSYLLVAGGAGGGSGGFFGAGGGGAGGLLTGTISGASGSYSISIGGGGSGAGGTARGGNGGNSSISGVATAIGGGGGAAVSTGAGGNKHGASGGSGGGGGHDSGSGSGGSGTSGQGNNGGNGQQDGGGGGGGGKGSAGSAGGSGGGAGGTGGQYSTIASATSSGDNGYYASGGSGGNNGTARDGGGGASGGGGQGNTGGGGGKQSSGGSGICIMYYTASSQLASGGSVTNSGGVYYHKFTSGGTFSI